MCDGLTALLLLKYNIDNGGILIFTINKNWLFIILGGVRASSHLLTCLMV